MCISILLGGQAVLAEVVLGSRWNGYVDGKMDESRVSEALRA
jgi:hypothetical protein